MSGCIHSASTDAVSKLWITQIPISQEVVYLGSVTCLGPHPGNWLGVCSQDIVLTLQ